MAEGFLDLIGVQRAHEGQDGLTHAGANALFHTGFVAFGLAYY